MKWVHPKTVMLAKIQGRKINCDTCFHDGRLNPHRRMRDGGYWCGKRLKDPNPHGSVDDPNQVCRHWKPK